MMNKCHWSRPTDRTIDGLPTSPYCSLLMICYADLRHRNVETNDVNSRMSEHSLLINRRGFPRLPVLINPSPSECMEIIFLDPTAPGDFAMGMHSRQLTEYLNDQESLPHVSNFQPFAKSVDDDESRIFSILKHDRMVSARYTGL